MPLHAADSCTAGCAAVKFHPSREYNFESSLVLGNENLILFVDSSACMGGVPSALSGRLLLTKCNSNWKKLEPATTRCATRCRITTAYEYKCCTRSPSRILRQSLDEPSAAAIISLCIVYSWEDGSVNPHHLRREFGLTLCNLLPALVSAADAHV